MILHSVRLQGWRCFADSVHVGPFSDTLNVIYAPNASGKSTLFEGVMRGLLDSHRARGREVEFLRPWGRSLAPAVTLEFFHAGADYRLTKRFLDDAFAELERAEDGRLVRFAEGGSADTIVQEMLTGNPPQRGLARREHWGLAQVLWAPQGEMALVPLSGDTVSDIHRVLGAQVFGPGAGELEKRIAQLYEMFYTPTGRLRSGREAPELVLLQGRLEQAQDRRQRAVRDHQEFEELARKVEDLRARHDETARSAKALEEEAAKIRPKAEEYARLLSAYSARQEQVTASEAQHDALKQRTDNILKARLELAEAEKQCRSLEEDLAIREQAVAGRQAEAEKAAAALEDVRRERPKVKEAQDEAELARQYLDDAKGVSELRERLAKARRHSKTLERVEEQRSKLRAPDDKALRAIRAALKGRDEAQLRLESALITVQVVPSRRMSLSVVEAEEIGSRDLAPGQPVEVKGSPRVALDLADVGRVRAWGPTGSIDEMRAAVENHSREFADLTREFGTQDLEELEALGKEAVRLDGEIAKSKAEIEAILPSGSIRGVDSKLAGTETVVENMLRKRPKWRKRPPDLASLRKKAEAVREEFVDSVEAAEGARDVAQGALATANESKAGTSVRLEETKKRVQSLKRTLNELTIDRKTDAQRAEELATIARRWEAAKAGLHDVEIKLGTFDSDPRTDLEQTEKLRQSAEQEARKALVEEKREEGRLEQLSLQGTYSALVRIEEEVTALTDAVSREQLRVDAVGLLYTFAQECKADALAAVAEPVEQVATRTLRRIAGDRLASIQLGEALEPAHVVPLTIKEVVSIDRVSGGEKEQIYLATRLALAQVLCGDGRQLVVLDDVLSDTDSGRMGRVMKILEEASQDLQIIILTCHPERYGALEQAEFFDLERLRRSQ